MQCINKKTYFFPVIHEIAPKLTPKNRESHSREAYFFPTFKKTGKVIANFQGSLFLPHF